MIVATLTSQICGENPGYCEESRSNFLKAMITMTLQAILLTPGTKRQLKLSTANYEMLQIKKSTLSGSLIDVIYKYLEYQVFKLEKVPESSRRILSPSSSRRLQLLGATVLQAKGLMLH